MMIDANNDKMINAVKGKLYDVAGVTDTMFGTIAVSAQGNNIVVDSAEEFSVEVYAADGLMLSRAKGKHIDRKSNSTIRENIIQNQAKRLRL